MNRWLVLAVALLCFALLTVASIQARAESGVASLYHTAGPIACKPFRHSGARAMVAAHKTLPCGTRVRVHRGKRSVDVTIIDRGPYIRGRIIDLSYAAGAAIGITRQNGIAPVKIEVLK